MGPAIYKADAALRNYEPQSLPIGGTAHSMEWFAKEEDTTTTENDKGRMTDRNQRRLDTGMWLQQSLQTRAFAVRTYKHAAKLLLHRLADIFTTLAELAYKSERAPREEKWVEDALPRDVGIGVGENIVPNDPNNAEHWLEKAEQARQVATTVKDPEVKRLLEVVAENYQRLAEVGEGEGTT